MIKLTFKNSNIELYDDFIIINKDINNSIKIYKNEISYFILEKTAYKTNIRSGSLGGSVRVSKGVYLRTSTPYYKTVTTKRYTPKLVLKTLEKIVLDTILDNDMAYTLYQENIRRFSLWIKSADLNEFNNNAKIERERIIEEASKSVNYVTIIMGWFIVFILSFFSGNSNLIIFLFFCPMIFILFLTLKDYIKKRQWVKAIIVIFISILSISTLMS